MNKKIDQISFNLDALIDSETSTTELNPESVFKKHHAKKMKEQHGNRKMLIGVLLAIVALALINPDKFNLIHLGLFFVLGVINLWVNESARKKIESVDITSSFNNFADQRRLIAQAILGQFKILKVTSIVCIGLAYIAAIWRFTVEKDLLYFGLAVILMAVGSFIALRASHQGVREYERLSRV